MIKSALKTAKILVVDDQQANIDVLHDFLELQGYENIKTTTDPRNVIQLLHEFEPDIILLDMAMPYLNGFEVMEQLKSVVDPSIYLPVLVLTADVTIETKRKALQSGASDFLTKPFDLIELQARVNTHLQIRFKNEQINVYAAELERLIATKDKFFSIIAHDLRNPFVGIENFTKILLKQGKFDLNEIEKQLQTIHSAAVQGHELLENLLKWARSQTGSISTDFDVFRLSDAVYNCFSLIHTQAENKNIQLVCSIADDILIESDQYILETILRNLLSNAVKFTPSSGKVTADAFIDGNFIEVSVTDTGVGIKKELKNNLFLINSRLQSKKGTNGEAGSGLGLILCKEFVDKLEGTIWVETDTNNGATFKFRLPYTIN